MKVETLQTDTPILYGIDLTDTEKKEFDYLEGDELAGAQFFRYKDSVHWLGNFMVITPKPVKGDFLEGWHGMLGTGFFHSYLVAIAEDCESVTLGQATS